ncbi:uncharacterized protein [Nicotiana tomentosiformis]|uniref:uncharacterized protein n=1 Tax=Nicotiana tomentosiformis TaxID=4098 RepID=UPI000878D095|nr:uncharacterized protein LOC108944759 [Nicotiana tomentosiformis]
MLIIKEVQLAKSNQIWKLARNQYLKQKCKAHWLNSGDMNTKFFHSVLKARRNTNRIFTIRDNAWAIRNDMSGIAEAFVEFYTSFLGTKYRDKMRVCSATVKQGPVVLAEQRGMLIAEFTMEEMKQALWDISGYKAPGPDGYGSQFFKDCWRIIKEDLKAG